MKGILSLVLGASLVLAFSTGFAKETTSMDSNWTCSTNASSSSVAADKAADKQMKTAKSASDAFSFASQNCRDCTKITCKSK